MYDEMSTGQPWPKDKALPTRDTRVVALTVYDWRQERFYDEAVPDPDEYPIHGWIRVRHEETEAGHRYEIREWRFDIQRPDGPAEAAA